MASFAVFSMEGSVNGTEMARASLPDPSKQYRPGGYPSWVGRVAEGKSAFSQPEIAKRHPSFRVPFKSFPRPFSLASGSPLANQAISRTSQEVSKCNAILSQFAYKAVSIMEGDLLPLNVT